MVSKREEGKGPNWQIQRKVRLHNKVRWRLQKMEGQTMARPAKRQNNRWLWIANYTGNTEIHIFKFIGNQKRTIFVVASCKPTHNAWCTHTRGVDTHARTHYMFLILVSIHQFSYSRWWLERVRTYEYAFARNRKWDRFFKLIFSIHNIRCERRRVQTHACAHTHTNIHARTCSVQILCK